MIDEACERTKRTRERWVFKELKKANRETLQFKAVMKRLMFSSKKKGQWTFALVAETKGDPPFLP